MKPWSYRACGLLLCSCLLTACGSDPKRDSDGVQAAPAGVPATSDAEVRDEPLSRYGNPASYEVFGKRYYTLKSSRGYRERGIASWYGAKFHGKRTSSGEPYDMYQMTAAHKTLPLPCYVEVRNMQNGRTAVLRVNDRGPFHEGRIIDLSYAAALKLDIVGTGTGFVEVRAVTRQDLRDPKPAPRMIEEPPKDRPLSTLEPVPTGSASGGPSAYVQLGAFRERANAEALIQRLQRELGMVARLSDVDAGGAGRLYRVRLGPYADVVEIDALLARLHAEAGLPEAQVVIEP